MRHRWWWWLFEKKKVCRLALCHYPLHPILPAFAFPAPPYPHWQWHFLFCISNIFSDTNIGMHMHCMPNSPNYKNMFPILHFKQPQSTQAEMLTTSVSIQQRTYEEVLNTPKLVCKSSDDNDVIPRKIFTYVRFHFSNTFRTTYLTCISPSNSRPNK